MFFIFFSQNIDCGYTLELPCQDGSLAEAVLTSTHNSMFWSKDKEDRYTTFAL